jgi:hypothetical protein
MPYTYSMKLEQVLPLLRDGKTITRSKPHNNSDKTTVIFVKIEESKLKFKCIWSDGEVLGWNSYRLRSEDILSEDWEVAG